MAKNTGETEGVHNDLVSISIKAFMQYKPEKKIKQNWHTPTNSAEYQSEVF